MKSAERLTREKEFLLNERKVFEEAQRLEKENAAKQKFRPKNVTGPLKSGEDALNARRKAFEEQQEEALRVFNEQQEQVRKVLYPEDPIGISRANRYNELDSEQKVISCVADYMAKAGEDWVKICSLDAINYYTAPGPAGSQKSALLSAELELEDSLSLNLKEMETKLNVIEGMNKEEVDKIVEDVKKDQKQMIKSMYSELTPKLKKVLLNKGAMFREECLKGSVYMDAVNMRAELTPGNPNKEYEPEKAMVAGLYRKLAACFKGDSAAAKWLEDRANKADLRVQQKKSASRINALRYGLSNKSVKAVGGMVGEFQKKKSNPREH